jgi:glycosyltransferase involved in cell wall biosynthesis
MSKIVHFGKYYFPDAGGIESVTLSMARGAASSGFEATVICFGRQGAARDEVVDGVRIRRAPVQLQVVSQPLGFRYMLLCLEEARTADWIHLHAPNMLGALCALLIGKKPRLLVHWHSDVVNKGLIGRLLRPMERALLKRANAIVATSPVYAGASPTLRPFLHKVRVVPIGVPDARVGVLEAPPSQLERKLDGRKVILAVGRLVPYKGFDVLIEAARDLLDDAAVVIVGGGPMEPALRTAIASLGLEDKVHLAGKLSPEALHRLFSRASLFCMPSTNRAEAFGVVLLEAMAYGLPIVATDIPGSGVPWVNAHDLCGLNVPVSNPRAMASACNRILASETERARLAQGARARFLEEFTEVVSVKRMMEIYVNCPP